MCNAQAYNRTPILITKDSIKNGWVFTEHWLHTTQDSAIFSGKDYNDAAWNSIDGSFSVNVNYAEQDKNKKSVISWYRHYFTVDNSLTEVPLNLEIIHNGASEVYLDGNLLAKSGVISKNGKSQYKSLRNNIHLFVLKDTGVHVLAVRYEGYQDPRNARNKDFGFYVSIQNANQSVKDELKNTERITFYCMLIFGVFIALAFVHFLLFIFYRSALYNFYFGLFNLSMALISLAVYLKWSCENPFIQSIALESLFYIMCMWCFSITAFVNTLFGKKRKRFKVMALICLGILFSVFFSKGLAYSLISMFFVAVVIEAFIVIIKAMLRKDPGAFIVGFGILLLTFFVITLFIVGAFSGGNISVSDGSNGSKIIAGVAIVALISVPISISAYLPWKFALINRDLEKQLDHVKALSEKNLQQEKEKKQLLETQNERLEKEVAQRTEEIKTEKQKSDDLLLNILPAEIAEELKLKGESKAHKYDEVSVLFTDFVNFTKTSEKLGVEELLHELNVNFTAFDRIMEKHGLEKIKTIGDAYLAVSGLPNENPRHAQNAVNAAMEIAEFIKQRKTEVPYGLDIRIGIHSGSLIAGIIGVKKFAYDIWGDTVNTAARMEQSSEPGKVNISAATYMLVKEEYVCTYRGKIDAKGKGELDMYFVNERTKQG